MISLFLFIKNNSIIQIFSSLPTVKAPQLSNTHHFSQQQLQPRYKKPPSVSVKSATVITVNCMFHERKDDGRGNSNYGEPLTMKARESKTNKDEIQLQLDRIKLKVVFAYIFPWLQITDNRALLQVWGVSCNLNNLSKANAGFVTASGLRGALNVNEWILDSLRLGNVQVAPSLWSSPEKGHFT